MAAIDNLEALLAEIQAKLPIVDNPVLQMLDLVPPWFRRLGTAEGIAHYERHFGSSIPHALSLFYRFPALGCWLRANHDTDIFLDTGMDEEKPRTVHWYYRPHMVDSLLRSKSRMIYRVYPIELGGSTASLTLVGFAIVYATTTMRWPLVFMPFAAVFASLIIGSALCARYPKIRFVNEAEIDGFGYVHQPLDAILPVFLFGISTALLIVIRG